MKHDWWTCSQEDEKTISRRNVLLSAGLASLSLVAAKSALAQISVRSKPYEADDVLVVVFLRGGADGLNVVVPHGDDAYYTLRPTLAIASPKNGRQGSADRAVDLDGFFGLHPALTPLVPMFRDGKLAVGHACGSMDQTRSHFDAMSAMERGLPSAAGTLSTGWLARHLDTHRTSNSSPLRAVALGNVMPDSLRGASGAVSMEQLSDYRLHLPASDDQQFRNALLKLYGGGDDLVHHAAQDTLSALQTLSKLDMDQYRSRRGIIYPGSDLGNGLKQVAMLIKSRVGLEVACLDKGGWDTHVAQGGTTGWQASLLSDLAASLAAFHNDLEGHSARITTVVMTEFGRRAYENSGLGTDHGRASFMFVLGEQVNGGKVHGTWPGLAPTNLEGPGDLRVTTDYRNVLAEILDRRLGNKKVREVFPGLDYAPPGFLA